MSSFMKCSLMVGLMAARTVLAGSKPGYPYDPATTSNCIWWYDHTGTDTCTYVLEDNYITIDEFRKMNPSIGADCTGLKVGQSYCVELGAGGGDPVTTTTSTTATSTKPSSTSTTLATSTKATTSSTSTKPSTTITPSSTKPSNGIATPEPTQPQMVSNCDLFYFVKSGESCASVLSKNSITVDQLFAWNPSVNKDCSGLWADVNVCVSIIGHTPTTTQPGNGITTPTPIQPTIVANCDAFYFVPKGEACDTVAGKNGISVAELIKFNPSAGSNCQGLWADTYACVSIVGHTPGTPTGPGNGITTPTPFQPGMVTNCKTFHFVDGQTCQNVLDKYKITLANFYKWNPQVGSSCNNMWAKTYVCVGVL